MRLRITVEVENRDQARAIEAALTRDDVRAFAITVGALDTLPSDRARARVLRFVADRLDEETAATPHPEKP